MVHGCLRQTRVGSGPYVNHLIVTFVVRDQTHVVVHEDAFHFFIRSLDQGFFFFRYHDIAQRERQSSFKGIRVTQMLHVVQELRRCGDVRPAQYISNDVAQGLFGQQFVDVAHFVWNDLVEQDASHRRLNQLDDVLPVLHGARANLDVGVEIHSLLVVGNHHFFR